MFAGSEIKFFENEPEVMYLHLIKNHEKRKINFLSRYFIFSDCFMCVEGANGLHNGAGGTKKLN